MKKAAVVFRNQGPDAAARVLGVRGFDKLNKTRRDAFAGRNADRLAAIQKHYGVYDMLSGQRAMAKMVQSASRCPTTAR
jgi:hypothetical protein